MIMMKRQTDSSREENIYLQKVMDKLGKSTYTVKAWRC